MAVGLTAAGRFQWRLETDGSRFAKAITGGRLVDSAVWFRTRGFEIRRLQQRRFGSGF
ncbi:hypothetical protein OROGR_017969 [Orobanche gracilis]